MDIEPVRVWLKRTLHGAKVRSALDCVGSLLAGLLVLYLSFWASYAVIWFISHSFFPLRHHTLLLIAGAFMTLVVIVGARQNREQLDPLERQVQMARDMDITLTPWNRYGSSSTESGMPSDVASDGRTPSLAWFEGQRQSGSVLCAGCNRCTPEPGCLAVCACRV